MKQFTTLLLLFQLISFANAQSDPAESSGLTRTRLAIVSTRKELLNSFLSDDPAGVGLWADSLGRLEDANFASLMWDERWLLYFWSETYGTALEEAATMDANLRVQQSWKIQPPKDSLFEWVDYTLFENRFKVYESIQNAFLSTEEKAFATMLFDYLLRNTRNEEEWAEQLQNFENTYPGSRFLPFVRSIKPNVIKPSTKALGISAGFMAGNWNNNLERTLRSPYAFSFDAYYWTERWNLVLDGFVGGPLIDRNVTEEGYIWPKGDQTTLLAFGLQFGYDVINSPKLRVFPSIGGGIGMLSPATPAEDEDPLPDYYENFDFTEFHLSGALTTDVKLFSKNYRDWGTPKGSYHGLRLRLGWNGLQFGKQNPALKGSMLYLSIQYNFFGFLPKKS